MADLPDYISEAPDPRDVVRALFKRLWVIPLVIALSALGGYLTLELWTAKYESEARLMAVGTPRVESTYYNPLPTRGDAGVAPTVAEAVRSSDVLREVVLALGLQDRDLTLCNSDLKNTLLDYKKNTIKWLKEQKKWFLEKVLRREPEPEEAEPDSVVVAMEDLEDNLTVEAVEKTDMIVVTVLDPDAEVAARIGNAIAYAYVLFNLEQQAAETAQKYGPAHPVSMQIQESVRRMRRLLSSPAVGREWKSDFGAGSVQIVEHAYPASEPKKPRKDYVWGGFLGGGFVASFFIIFLLELVDPTFRGPEDVRRAVAAPLLGVIPRKAWRSPFSLASKAPSPPPVTAAAHHIQAALASKPGARRIFFAAADRHPGNREFVRALARCLSRVNAGGERPSRVLLVEPDLSGLPASETAGRRGAVDVLMGTAEDKDAVFAVDPSLGLIALEANRGKKSRGSGGSLLPFEPAKCRSFLDRVSGNYDVVLFSGPDFSRRAEFLFLSSLCQATIVLINEQETRRKALASMMHALSLNGVSPVGAVLNNRSRPLPGFLYRAV